MFKLLSLKVTDHQQLGNIALRFVDENDSLKGRRPYTSVIIGPNGTGKSFILRTIADVFSSLNDLKRSRERSLSLSYGIHLRYSLFSNTYEVISSKLITYDRKGRKDRSFFFFKNRPIDFEVFSEGKIQFNPDSTFEINLNEIELPEKLIVSSVMLNDRFLYHNSHHEDFYQYLGVRSTSSSSSTRSSTRRTITHLFNARSNDGFLRNLKELLQFLEFKLSFKIHYKTKINNLFFSGKLKKEDFKQYYEHWWAADFKYSKRKKDNPLWSIPYYNQHFKNNDQRTSEIIRFLNRTVSDGARLLFKDRSRSRLLEVDLFDSDLSTSDFEMIKHLENLDIINLDGIRISKENSNLSANDISSGEYHLLISSIGMFSKMEQNALILIDEPEISLHPNWQMKYVSFIKDVFRKFNSCHFVLTTHSHFLVSDLEGENSSVIALNRDNENRILATLLEGKDTFGWSAEEVLYNVFNVRTTRNMYLEAELRELLHKIAIKSNDHQRMRVLLNNLKKLPLNKLDPMRIIITKAEEYLTK